MTVSRALYDPDAVKEVTRLAVLKVVADLKYTPNTAARILAGVPPMRFGVLLNDLGPAFLSDILVGCLSVANLNNAQVIIQNIGVGDDPTIAVGLLLDGKVDGVVLPPPVAEDEQVIDQLHRAKVPMVSLTASDPDDRVLAVHINDADAAEMMVRHLVELGHRKIGFINGSPNLAASKQRFAGYAKALAIAGISLDTSLVAYGDYTYPSALVPAEELLTRARPVSAIFAGNDEMAIATIAVAHRLGLDVPADLTVCGFDDTVMATSVWPQLTTVRQPLLDMTKAAMTMLIEEATASSGVPIDRRHKIFGHELIRRQSDASPRRMPTAKARLNDIRKLARK